MKTPEKRGTVTVLQRQQLGHHQMETIVIVLAVTGVAAAGAASTEISETLLHSSEKTKRSLGFRCLE
jgi:hypothetical protein